MRLLLIVLSCALMTGCSGLESAAGNEIKAASAAIDRQLEIMTGSHEISMDEFIRIADEDMASIEAARQRVRTLQRSDDLAGSAEALEYLDAGQALIRQAHAIMQGIDEVARLNARAPDPAVATSDDAGMHHEIDRHHAWTAEAEAAKSAVEEARANARAEIDRLLFARDALASYTSARIFFTNSLAYSALEQGAAE